MGNLMDSFAKAAPGSTFRVEEKSGLVSFLYEGELKSVDVSKRTIGILHKFYKGKVYTVSVDNIISVNGHEPWDAYSPKTAPPDGQNIIEWDGDKWLNSYSYERGFDMEAVFSRIPEGTELVMPADFCGTQVPQHGLLALVDYQTGLAILESITSPGQKIKVPMDKVAAIENGVIKPVK
ncbi:hypothetical protein K5D33_20940 [Pseudomonas cichorii]|nr:hypothetical protein [Pseudomonas cichorii]MBX8489271.1 hypothetical protein [Pseudomonas cichorii]MBX8537173.1 hypothetical protein [Pseudomonas cichorii]